MIKHQSEISTEIELTKDELIKLDNMLRSGELDQRRKDATENSYGTSTYVTMESISKSLKLYSR
jgi:hypothetical protein